MANFANLKAAINAVIKANGQREITGEVMNQVLTAMVNSLGSNYQFAGVATPSTNPGTPDQNVFYMATQAGTYTNFSAIVLQAGISILLWNGIWSSETFFTVDSVPTSGSNNFITSGAVFDKFKLDGGAYDVSAHNNNATFADLSAILNSENLNTLIPVAVRHGGMSIKFVRTSDNKYVQYRLTSQNFNTNPVNWQKSGLEVSALQVIGNFKEWERGFYYDENGVKTSFSGDTYGVLPPIDVSDIIGGPYLIDVRLQDIGLAYVLFLDSSNNVIESYRPQDTITGIIPNNAKWLLVTNKFIPSTSAPISQESPFVILNSINSINSTQVEIKKQTSIIGNFGKWERGFYYDENGVKTSFSGDLWDAYGILPPIDVSQLNGNEYTIEARLQDIGSAYVLFLDSSNNVIESYRPQDTITGIIPNNAKYLLVSNRFYTTVGGAYYEYPFVLIDNAFGLPSLKQLLGKTTKNNLEGKKITFLGDSITEGIGASPLANRYSTLLCSYYRAIENNLGVAGTCLATNAYNREDATRFAARATSENLANSALIVIFGGTNDFSYDTKAIGDLFAESSITPHDRIGAKKLVPITDTDTFAGAIHNLIDVVRTNCPNIPIVLVTPINRGRFTYSNTIPTSDECNVNGDYLSDFRNAIIQIGAFYSIPVLNLDGSELDFANAAIATNLSADNLHPNNKGHYIISKLLFNFIENNLAI